MFKVTTMNYLLLILICLASTTALANSASFKVAVIENARGSAELFAGNVSEGMDKLNEKEPSPTSFDTSTGLCVAYMKSELIEKAESVCTTAIEQIESLDSRHQSTQYLTSLSYSNRGISRYIKKDITGALDDLTTAILIDSNPITQSNLHTAKKYILTQSFNTLVTIAQ